MFNHLTAIKERKREQRGDSKEREKVRRREREREIEDRVVFKGRTEKHKNIFFCLQYSFNYQKKSHI